MRKEIKSLTGLRGIAAILVMFDHYASLDFGGSFPSTLLPHMYVCVDIFMILSGFVLAMTYEARFSHLPRIAASKIFLKRRIARLYPLYLLTTLICFVLCRQEWLTFLHPDASVAALAANLLAVQTWYWPSSSLNGPGWSISTEWAASLLFPLLMPAVLFRSFRFATIIAATALAILLICAILFGSLFDIPESGSVNIIHGPQALGRCVSEFVFGIYLWRLRSGSVWTYVFARNSVQTALFVSMLITLLEVKLDVLFVTFSGFLTLGLSFETSRLSRLLASGPARSLGLISYSIYLLHVEFLPIRDLMAHFFEAQGIQASWSLAVFLTAFLTLLAAAFTYHFLERPFQRWINRLSTRRLAPVDLRLNVP